MSPLYIPYVSSEFWIQAFELPLLQQMVPTAEQGNSLPPLNPPRALLGVGQGGSRNLNVRWMLAVWASVSQREKNRKGLGSASLWKLHPFQFFQATKSLVIHWSLAHGCGPAEPGHWGSSVVAVGVMEGSFPVARF